MIYRLFLIFSLSFFVACGPGFEAVEDTNLASSTKKIVSIKNLKINQKNVAADLEIQEFNKVYSVK